MATHAIAGTFSGTGTLTPDLADFIHGKGIVATFSGSGSLDLDTDQISYKRAIVHTFSDFVSDLDLNLDTQYFLITRSQVWWNKAYLYRRILQLQPNEEGYEVDHPLYTILSRDLIRQHKVRPDAADIEVLRLVTHVPEVWEVLPKDIVVTDSLIKVTWPNQIEIEPETTIRDIYYVYYGNNTLIDEPDDIDYDPDPLPVVVDHDSGRITYTRPEEHWSDGIALEDGARATLRFYGPDVSVFSTTGPEWGIAEVQIDEGDWRQVDLYSPVEEQEVEIFSATGLSVAPHFIRVRRSGFKAASASDYKVNITNIKYLRHNLMINMGEEADETLMWGSVIGGVVGK